MLSFVAGYIDSSTYLALFGVFVAQVTGSLVIAGVQIVKSEPPHLQDAGARLRLFRGGARPSLGGALPRRGLLGLVIGGLLLLVFDRQPKQPDR